MPKKKTRPSKRRQNLRPGSLAWALILLFLLLTTLVLLKVLSPSAPPTPQSKPSETVFLSKTRSKALPEPSKPLVALIIDDMGQRPRLERKFFELGLTLNFSFLPYAPFTRKLAIEAHQKGFTVMLHIPMEAENGDYSGRKSLKIRMNEHEIKALLKNMIARVPYVAGANQHMGSLFSQDPQKMKWVLEVLKEKKLFFIDSRTTPHTVAPFIARSLKIPFAQRDYFLDNSLKRKDLEKSFEKMLGMARRKRRLIVIAHPHPQTLELLKRHRKELLYHVKLVPISKLLEGRDE